MGHNVIWAWVFFVLLILVFLALDLGVFHRRSKVVSARSSLIWSGIWIVISLLFGLVIYAGYSRHWFGLGTGVDPADGATLTGWTALVKYLTAYIVEKSLSIDNIFVIAMIFGAFAIPSEHQHRVLFWGILGALLMRGLMIVLGSELIKHFHWVLYLFGGFLILTGIRMLMAREHH
ncbi:MAG: hypothetical protein JNM63_17835, partial [Spirochaetia bacterium]|nr:hypothetical protein [Spirochaetia bacterium]